jgi:hypothetical protein
MDEKGKRETPQQRYHKKYRKNKIISFFTNTEADMLEWLESQKNQAGYIKQLIRADIEKAKQN